jgi:hypothetical protein
VAELIECKACKKKCDPNKEKCSKCGAWIKTWTERIIDRITPVKLAKWFLGMIGVVLLLIAGVFGRYFTFFNGQLSPENTDWGTFGDFIGGTLNPILSFLSLIALLTTIVLQSKELELTRNELELTRDELKRSAKAQEDTKEILDKQSETLARQQFESTFFSLLDQHNKILGDITSPITASSTTFSSQTSYSHTNKVFNIMDSIFRNDVTNLELANITLKSLNSICGHYFSVLYQLLKFIAINSPDSSISKSFDVDEIKNAELSDYERMYSNIVRAFLGYEIMQLLAVNCFCNNREDSHWRYKLLIERYALLKHMPLQHYLDRNLILKETIDFYDSSAFGNSAYLKKHNEGLKRLAVEANQ